MKKAIAVLLAFLLMSTMLLAGCGNNENVTNTMVESAMPSISATPTIMLTPVITPTHRTNAISQQTETPFPTISPTPYYSYPDDHYNAEAWENLTNYRFDSVSGVNEKKAEDFETIEEFEEYMKEECYKKYIRLRDYVSLCRNSIDALYIHAFIYYDMDGHTLKGKMDVVVTDPFLIREWIYSVLEFDLKENEYFTLSGIPCGVGTNLLYCIEINGEIVEFFVNSNMDLVYTQEYLGRNPYGGDQLNDVVFYNKLDYVDRQIRDAVQERYLEIYKDPINYPYILD